MHCGCGDLLPCTFSRYSSQPPSSSIVEPPLLAVSPIHLFLIQTGKRQRRDKRAPVCQLYTHALLTTGTQLPAFTHIYETNAETKKLSCSPRLPAWSCWPRCCIELCLVTQHAWAWHQASSVAPWCRKPLTPVWQRPFTLCNGSQPQQTHNRPVTGRSGGRLYVPGT